MGGNLFSKLYKNPKQETVWVSKNAVNEPKYKEGDTYIVENGKLKKVEFKTFEDKIAENLRHDLRTIPVDLSENPAESLLLSYNEETSRKNLKEFCFWLTNRKFYEQMIHYFVKHRTNQAALSADWNFIIFHRGAVSALREFYDTVNSLARNYEQDQKDNL